MAKKKQRCQKALSYASSGEENEGTTSKAMVSKKTLPGESHGETTQQRSQGRMLANADEAGGLRRSPRNKGTDRENNGMRLVNKRRQRNRKKQATKKREEEEDSEEGGKTKRPRREVGLEDLTGDDFEHLARFLDTKSALALLRASKAVKSKLMGAGGFWRMLCLKEKFHEYTILKGDDEGEFESEEDEEDAAEEPSPKGKEERLTWTGEKFHDVRIPRSAPYWHRIFMRGVQMRRNICLGRYELWRLFLTGPDHLPVKKMTSETTSRELRSSHRGSPFNRPHRRVRIHRYWNEDFLVAVQHSASGGFNDIFVWGWQECQRPRFLYTTDLRSLYPAGLFPTAFFLHRNHLVLMPDPVLSVHHHNAGDAAPTQTSMIRVHDLSKNMELIGKYDFPEDSGYRRHVRMHHGHSHEASHLHKIGDVAVALCHVPDLRLFAFSLPECTLLADVKLPLLSSPTGRVLEDYDLDQRFLMRDNSMMFMFHDQDFFSQDIDDEDKHGAMVFVDFEDFVAARRNKDKKNLAGLIKIWIDPTFDVSSDYVEKISVLSKTKLVCSMTSGKILVREVTFADSNSSSSSAAATVASHKETLVISPPEPLKEDYDSSTDTELDVDGPTLCVSRDGDLVVEMRHFVLGRKLYAYDLRRGGERRYCIDLDDPRYNLSPRPGYVSIDMDGNFLCAADVGHIVVWDSRSGRHIREVPIAPHYAPREDPSETEDRFCWKGHTDFAFAEDGIIIIHSQRNFPVAADVMLFW